MKVTNYKGEIMKVIKNKLIELVNGIYTEEDLIDELQNILVEYKNIKGE